MYAIPPVKADSAVEADQVLVGQVTKILPDQGLLVRLPMYKCGLVALTDLKDSYVENPLENFEVMQLVRYAVTFLTRCLTRKNTKFPVKTPRKKFCLMAFESLGSRKMLLHCPLLL